MMLRVTMIVGLALLLGGCAEQQAMDYAKELVETKADLALPDANGLTPIQGAIAGGYPEAMVYLLDNGVDVNQRGLNDLTPLHAAAAFERPEIAKTLLKRGAAVSLLSKSQGYTPLHLAARSGNPKMIELLLQAGADINASSLYEQTPLTLGASQGHMDVVRLLLTHKANVNPPVTQPYDSPLDAALRGEHSSIAKLLREHGGKLVSFEE
ncbi:MAG: ankyrin repeat domain-containing protein [Phycisphaerales bacterium]|jgi:ankyrin repeat protein|nr:ankyrin repeat domain-containing protein [Phycisphaerales bacterium]MBT7170734.1 ankyrin repeat domain-containing protein [Phycisphaerales bacterium]